MNDISDLLRELLDRYSNTPELDQEFERMRREDEEFDKEYIVWCEENGYSVKDGYRDFINEIIESQDSYWDNYRSSATIFNQRYRYSFKKRLLSNTIGPDVSFKEKPHFCGRMGLPGRHSHRVA